MFSRFMSYCDSNVNIFLLLFGCVARNAELVCFCVSFFIVYRNCHWATKKRERIKKDTKRESGRERERAQMHTRNGPIASLIGMHSSLWFVNGQIMHFVVCAQCRRERTKNTIYYAIFVHINAKRERITRELTEMLKRNRLEYKVKFFMWQYRE